MIVLAKPFRLNLVNIVCLDFIFVWVLYMLCVDDRSALERSIGHQALRYEATLLFDQMVLSATRTVFLVLVLRNVKKDKEAAVCMICGLVGGLMLVKFFSYGTEHMSISISYFFMYSQVIGLMEFLSAFLPEGKESYFLFRVQNKEKEVQNEEIQTMIEAAPTATERANTALISRRNSLTISKVSAIKPYEQLKYNERMDDIQSRTYEHNYYSLLGMTYKQIIDIAKSRNYWTFEGKTNEIEIFRKDDPSLYPTVMGTGYTSLSPKLVAAIIKNIDARSKWDDTISSVDVIEKIDQSARVLLLSYKSQWPIEARDICVIEDMMTDDNDDIIILSTSVHHQQAPARASHVRGELKFSGWILSNTYREPSKTKISLICQTNYGGLLPQFITNLISAQQIQCISSLRNFDEKYPDDFERITKAMISGDDIASPRIAASAHNDSITSA